MRAGLLKFLLNIYPPYLGAGIRVKHISADFRTFEVEMKLRWYNRNMMGTHFGGNLSSMTDPFFMLILIHNLGKNYIVWDQASSMTFKRPGRSKVSARFKVSQEEIQMIMSETEGGAPFRPAFFVDIVDEQDNVITQVEKVLYVKKKEPKKIYHSLYQTTH
ncbi:DUF4442 domain-containing protein [Kangiella sp. M94]